MPESARPLHLGPPLQLQHGHHMTLDLISALFLEARARQVLALVIQVSTAPFLPCPCLSAATSTAPRNPRPGFTRSPRQLPRDFAGILLAQQTERRRRDQQPPELRSPSSILDHRFRIHTHPTPSHVLAPRFNPPGHLHYSIRDANAEITASE